MIPTFYLQWWYSPDTKLGLYFNSFGLNGQNQILSAQSSPGLDYTNGMACSIEEDYHVENMITKHPVENGQTISDHIVPLPNIINITGIITSLRPIPIVGGLSFSQLGDATQLLFSMAKCRTGISLTTGLLYGAKYFRADNLAVQALDIPRNNTYGRSSIKFTMSLMQLIITNKNATITPSSFSQASSVTGVVVPT